MAHPVRAPEIGHTVMVMQPPSALTLRNTLPSLGTFVIATAMVLSASGCSNSSERADTGLPAASSAAVSSGTAPGLPNGDATGPRSSVQLTVAAGADAGDAEGRSLTLPEGWSAEVWADVSEARLAAWAPDGRLVVSTGDRGALYSLTPTTAGRAPTRTPLLEGLSDPQGIAFTEYQGRQILVVGEETRIVAWDYTGGAVSNRRVIIDDLPSSGHGSKAVAIRNGMVYYSLGSSQNRDPADRTATPQRGVIARISLGGTGNTVFASGVRNGFGLDFAPDDTLFVAVNHADNQPYPYRDDSDDYGQTVREYVNENPVEQVTRISEGADLGWPHCVPDTRGRADKRDLPYVADPVNNTDGRELNCAALPNTMLGLPAHSAPLGLAFTANTPVQAVLGSGAIITAHGSWNRRPPRPPYVAYAQWDTATRTLGPAVELVTGFQEDNGSRWGRAVTAIPGPDGSVYVTDDEAGLVYRLTPERLPD